MNSLSTTQRENVQFTLTAQKAATAAKFSRAGPRPGNGGGPGMGPPGGYHALSVIDLVGQKALPDIDTGALNGPHGLAFVGGKLWFTAEGAKVIATYDPVSSKIDWIMGTGQNRTHMIYVTPDQKQIYTTDVSSATVSILAKVALPPMGPPPGMRPPQGSPPPQAPPGGINRVQIGMRPSFQSAKAMKVLTYRPMGASCGLQMRRTARAR